MRIVIDEIELAACGPRSPAQGLPPETLGVRSLVEHVLATHHVVTASAAQALPPLARKVATVHGTATPALRRLEECVVELFGELAGHMEREEKVLFPYFLELAAAEERGTTCPRPAFETVVRPIRVMRMEHDAAGLLLGEIAELTHGYTAPDGACGSWTALYQGLGAHTADLMRHVWIENELLFPKAVELEAHVASRPG